MFGVLAGTPLSELQGDWKLDSNDKTPSNVVIREYETLNTHLGIFS